MSKITPLKNRIKLVIKIFILLIIVIGFVVINVRQNRIKNGLIDYYEGKTEFLRTVECARFFDQNPTGRFKISFDAKSEKAGKVRIYQDNDLVNRYGFNSLNADLTTEYQHFEFVVSPELLHEESETSFLAFFSSNGSGIIVSVKNIEIEEIISDE